MKKAQHWYYEDGEPPKICDGCGKPEFYIGREPGNCYHNHRCSITQEKFDQIVAEHSEWIQSGGEYGKRAEMVSVNLSDKGLDGANLAGANLSDSIVSTMVMGEFINGLNLDGAVAGSLFSSGYKNCSMIKTDARGSLIAYDDFDSCTMDGMLLDGSSMDFNYYINCSMKEIDFSKIKSFFSPEKERFAIDVRLSGSDLSNSTLTGVYFLYENILALMDIPIENCSFAGSNLEGFIVASCFVEDWSLIQNCDFTGATMYEKTADALAKYNNNMTDVKIVEVKAGSLSKG